jgi:hypothetical protein
MEPEWEEGDEIILVAKTNMVQQWAEKVLKDRKEPEIPPQYQQYAKVFSEEVAKQFPPAWLEDHAIKLKPGAPDTINCKVYPLNNDEREAMCKWIEENKEKNYIDESNSPWSTPWFFIKNKDGSLWPIHVKEFLHMLKFQTSSNCHYNHLKPSTPPHNHISPAAQPSVIPGLVSCTAMISKHLFIPWEIPWGFPLIPDP